MISARQFASRQTRHLLRELNLQIERAAATGEEDAIHRARIATRRWFAAVEAFDGYFDETREKELNKTLKQIFKASSGVRDCDVAEALLVRLKARPEILEKLAARRAKRSRRLAELLQQSVAKPGVGPLAKQVRAVSKLQPGVGSEPLPAAARRILAAAFKSLLKRGETAERERSSRRLHKFRIHAKELRYILELFEGQGTGFDDWIAPVRQIQSLLGDAHDCEAVADLIEGSRGYKAISARLMRRRDAKQRQFRRLWRERFSRATIPHPSATLPRRAPSTQQSSRRHRTA